MVEFFLGFGVGWLFCVPVSWAFIVTYKERIINCALKEARLRFEAEQLSAKPVRRTMWG